MFVYLLIILVLINVFSFALMGIDKKRAVKGKRRIPEKVLLLVSFLFGGAGALLGALFWHHKTRKIKFIIGLPASIAVNLLLLAITVSVGVVGTMSPLLVFSFDDPSEVKNAAAMDPATLESLTDRGYQCAMVLGCGVYSDGKPTPMLRDRLDVGIALYKAGIVPKLLLSGDHGQEEYNEIGTMYAYCLDAGVPKEDIFLDHAGFSTYDSVHRAQSIFCVKSMIIVTQTYHESRALYIAKELGIDAVGIASDQKKYMGEFYYELRETLARFKDVIKVTFKASPHFGGDRIPITGSSEPSHA